MRKEVKRTGTVLLAAALFSIMTAGCGASIKSEKADGTSQFGGDFVSCSGGIARPCTALCILLLSPSDALSPPHGPGSFLYMDFGIHTRLAERDRAVLALEERLREKRREEDPGYGSLEALWHSP